MDSIAAMAVSTVDQNDRETHQILFVNNAGKYSWYMHSTPHHTIMTITCNVDKIALPDACTTCVNVFVKLTSFSFSTAYLLSQAS